MSKTRKFRPLAMGRFRFRGCRISWAARWPSVGAASYDDRDYATED